MATAPDPAAGQGAERGALYRSPDGGLTWAGVPLPDGSTPTALSLSPRFAQDGLLLVGTAGGAILRLPVTALMGEP